MAVTNADLAAMIGELKGLQAGFQNEQSRIFRELDRASESRKVIHDKLEALGKESIVTQARVSSLETTTAHLVETIDGLEALPGAVENLKALAPIVEKLNTLRMKTVYVGIGIVAVAGVIGYIASLFVMEIKAAIIRIFGGA